MSALVAASDAITELTSIEGIEDTLKANEFNVLSTYIGSDTENRQATDGLMEDAKAALEKMLQDEGLPERSIGWFRADIEKYPDLDFKQTGSANQLVMSSKYNLDRLLNFKSKGGDRQEDALSIGKQVRYLTGEFFKPIACSSIQAEDRENFDEVVFMGEATDLADEGGNLLGRLSQIDRYTFDQQRIGFYWNDDKECFK